MTEKERTRLRNKGIFTVTQLSHTFRPKRLRRRAKTHQNPHYFALQALAIRENTVYFHNTAELPTCKSQVYVDIEGVPDRNFNYLIGALIVSDQSQTFHSFLADTKSQKAVIFMQFSKRYLR
jgi:predicted RecB family nuclease